MDSRLTTLVSVVLLVIFAYLSSHQPEHLGTFFIIYIIATIAVTLVLGGRSAASIIRDIEYVKSGQVLLSISRSEVERLKSRDRMLQEELSKQSTALIPQMFTPFVFMILIFVPGVRDQIIQSIKNFLKIFGLEPNIESFISFLIFYGFFMIIFQIINFLTKLRLEKLGGRIEVPSFYIVTDKGLLLEGRTPIKAPAHISIIKVDTRRHFLEFKTKTTSISGTLSSKIRLYSDDPRKVEALLRSLTEQRG